MSYQPFIFPSLEHCVWAEVNLGELAEQEFPQSHGKNHLLDAEFCDNWVKRIAKEHHADMTWGGHFEDRQHLWRGYYEEAKKVTHLGVDYNVPSGTAVCAPRKCRVVHSWADSSIHNGWGGRIIVKMEEAWENAPYLIFGHLAHENLPPVGQVIEAGEVFGKTGKPIENGGWFPHLHVQCASEAFFKEHENNLELLDGYYLTEGEPFELAPNPTFLVGR